MGKLGRVQLVFKEELIEKIKAIKEEYGLTTVKSFFDNAVALLLWAIEETKEGRTIGSIDKNNMEIRKVVLPYLASKQGEGNKEQGKGKKEKVCVAASQR